MPALSGWRGDRYILDRCIAGSVSRGVAGWYAFGCKEQWEDAPLGVFGIKRDAQKAVEDWVEEQVGDERTKGEKR